MHGETKGHSQDSLSCELGKKEAEAFGVRVLGQLVHRVVADDLGGC